MIMAVVTSVAEAQSAPFGTYEDTGHALCPPLSGYIYDAPKGYGDWDNSANYDNYSGTDYGCRTQRSGGSSDPTPDPTPDPDPDSSGDSSAPFGTYEDTGHALCPPLSGYIYDAPKGYGDWDNSANYDNYSGTDYGCRTQRAGGTSDPTPDADDPDPAGSTRPTVPTGLRAAGAPGSQRLEWTASQDDGTVEGYDLYVNGLYKYTVRGGPSFSDGPFPIGSTWSLSAFDNAGQYSGKSGTWTVFADTATGGFRMVADGEEDTATPPSATTIVAHDEVNGRLRLIWRIPEFATPPRGYNVYRSSDDVLLATVDNGGSNVYSSSLLMYGESYYVTSFDANNNFSPRSPDYAIPMSIRGVPQTDRGHAQTIAAVGVRPTYNPSDTIGPHLSNLFAEFAPVRGEAWRTERSQKRQRDLNRAISNAILGFDQAAMTTHWAFLAVGDQNLHLMISQPVTTGTPAALTPTTEFSVTWGNATELERVNYLGIDALRWDLSRVFFEAYRTNMSNIYEINEAETAFYTNLVTGLFVGLVTGNLLSAYGIIGAAAGGFAGAATTSALNGGSTEEILEDGAIGAIKSALGEWITLEYDLGKWSSYAVTGAIAAIDYGLSGEGDPLVGALASMVPEVAEQAAQLDEYSLEEATEDAVEALTPIFGADARRFVLHSTQAVAGLLSQLTVLIALVPDIDIEVEAERMIGRIVDGTLGGDRDSLVFRMGDHVADIINGGIGSFLEGGGNPNGVSYAARSLNPTVAQFIGSATLSSAEEVTDDIVTTMLDLRDAGVPVTEWSQRTRDRLEQLWGFDLFRS